MVRLHFSEGVGGIAAWFTLLGVYEGPVIDVHAHVAFTEDQLVGGHHAVGVDALRSAVRVGNVVRAAPIVVARQGEPAATHEFNDAVPAAADDLAALSEVDRVGRLGAKILKLHPNTQGFDVADERVADVVRRAGQFIRSGSARQVRAAGDGVSDAAYPGALSWMGLHSGHGPPGSAAVPVVAGQCLPRHFLVRPGGGG